MNAQSFQWWVLSLLALQSFILTQMFAVMTAQPQWIAATALGLLTALLPCLGVRQAIKTRKEEKDDSGSAQKQPD